MLLFSSKVVDRSKPLKSLHCKNLPSKTAKFVNPMASNRRLTMSDSSGIYENNQQTINMGNFQL